MTAQEKIEKDIKFKPTIDKPTDPGFLIDKRDPNEGNNIAVPRQTAMKTIYEAQGSPNYIKESWSDIDAKNQPEPDDLMSIYKKYIKPPKENKETENSLRRLAIGEAIQKGIAGVGNVFSGKPTQFDSQPMSNTYLKSIEAADERRKRFDAQNHDYVNGMYNTEVNQWKYKKGKEEKAADQLRADKEKEADYANRLAIAELQETGKNNRLAKANEVRQKIAGLRLNNVAETDKIPSQYSETITTEGGNVYVAPQGLAAIYLKAKEKGYGKNNLVVNLQDIKPQDKVTMYNIITEAINNGDDDVFNTIQEVRYGGKGKQSNATPTPQSTQSGELEVWEP